VNRVDHDGFRLDTDADGFRLDVNADGFRLDLDELDRAPSPVMRTTRRRQRAPRQHRSPSSVPPAVARSDDGPPNDEIEIARNRAERALVGEMVAPGVAALVLTETGEIRTLDAGELEAAIAVAKLDARSLDFIDETPPDELLVFVELSVRGDASRGALVRFKVGAMARGGVS